MNDASAPLGASMRLETLIERYAAYIHAIVSRVARHACAEDIEEAASDALLSVWNARRRIDWASPSHRAYIAAVARNEGIRLRKRAGGAPDLVPLAEDLLACDALGPDEALERRERTRAVADAVRALDPPDPEIFARRYYLGDAIADIASALGMSERAVEGRLYRGRQRLKAMLEGGER